MCILLISEKRTILFGMMNYFFKLENMQINGPFLHLVKDI